MRNIWLAFFGTPTSARNTILAILIVCGILYITANRSEIAYNLAQTFNLLLPPVLGIAIAIYGLWWMLKKVSGKKGAK